MMKKQINESLSHLQILNMALDRKVWTQKKTKNELPRADFYIITDNMRRLS